MVELIISESAHFHMKYNKHKNHERTIWCIDPLVGNADELQILPTYSVTVSSWALLMQARLIWLVQIIKMFPRDVK